MNSFDVKIPVRTSSGGIRYITGTVNLPSPDKGRARVSVANEARKGLGPGESIDANAVEVHHHRPGGRS